MPPKWISHLCRALRVLTRYPIRLSQSSCSSSRFVPDCRHCRSFDGALSAPGSQGLLLQTNPDGITSNKMVFSVIVGTLTTSIVAFSFYLFMRELARQVLNALISADITEDAEDELAELEDRLEAAEHLDAAQRVSVASDGSALVPWDESNGNDAGAGAHSDSELTPDVST